MWVTNNNKTWYSEEEIKKIISYCQNIINECRSECGYNAYAGGKYDIANQILDLIKGLRQ